MCSTVCSNVCSTGLWRFTAILFLAADGFTFARRSMPSIASCGAPERECIDAVGRAGGTHAPAAHEGAGVYRSAGAPISLAAICC